MTHKLEKMLASSKPVLIAFLHAGQQNAVDVKYILEALSKKYGDKANFIKVDGSFDHVSYTNLRDNETKEIMV